MAEIWEYFRNLAKFGGLVQIIVYALNTSALVATFWVALAGSTCGTCLADLIVKA